MLAKITSEMMAMVGAKTAAEFPDKFAEFATEAKAMKDFMDDSQITLGSLKEKIDALEKSFDGKINNLGSKFCTKDDVREISASVANGVMAPNLPVTKASINEWAASDEGKKIIGAEASRITAEALASVGTTPAKPAPASAGGVETPEQKAAALNAEGKFEEAWALDKNIRAEFPTAKSYSAFMRANRMGQVKITHKN